MEAKFKNNYGSDECLNYQNPGNLTQRVTSFTTRTTVSLDNPQNIHNATASAGFVFVRLSEDAAATFTPRYLIAGQTLDCDVAEIGSTTDGTTVTDVVIQGVK